MFVFYGIESKRFSVMWLYDTYRFFFCYHVLQETQGFIQHTHISPYSYLNNKTLIHQT